MGLIIFLGLLLIGFYIVIVKLFSDEITSAREKDPAAKGCFQIVLLYSGLHAVMAHRLAHFFWRKNLLFLARFISQTSKFFTGIEIHPGAKIGQGLFIDHGTGVVIGETAIVGNNVTLFQGVTLGGTGKEIGKRHPTLEDHIVVGAGAKVLGNIIVGSNSYIGANAVVIKDVPANSTVVGVPGRITKQDGKRIDSAMDHVHVLDPVWAQIEELKNKIEQLEKEKINYLYECTYHKFFNSHKARIDTGPSSNDQYVRVRCYGL